MEEEKRKELESLIRKELKERFGRRPGSKKSDMSPEEKKAAIIKELERIEFVRSISTGGESPSSVKDFKSRPFHGKIGLFE